MRGKKLKKKLSALMAGIMVLMMLMGTVALAAGTDTSGNPMVDPDITEGTLFINKANAEFKAYKLLDATGVEGQNVYTYTATDAFKEVMTEELIKTISEKTSWIPANGEEMPDDWAAITRQITGAITEETEGIVFSGNQEVKLGIGYYIVLETTGAQDVIVDNVVTGQIMPSKPMLIAIPELGTDDEGATIWNFDVKADPKDESMTLTKKVEDEDYEAENAVEAIGQEVRYVVNASIPHYGAFMSEEDIASVQYALKDTMSKGLTFDAEAGVKVTADQDVELKGAVSTQDTAPADTDDTDYFIYTQQGQDGSTVIKLNFNYKKIMEYYELEITYIAKLNEDAVIGEANENNVELSYGKGDQTVITAPPAKVYTYGIGIEKVDKDLQTLEGAEFQLLDGSGKVIAGYKYENGSITAIQGGDKVASVDGKVVFVGLDEGTYQIKETKAPSGYQLAASPVTFVITATKENGVPTGEAEYTIKIGDTVVTDTDKISVEEVGDNVIAAMFKLVNTKGFQLPKTGDMGVWLSTFAGILIMAGAVIWFVNARRTAGRR